MSLLAVIIQQNKSYNYRSRGKWYQFQYSIWQ